MPFPVNSVLDNFNRADEEPLSGGGNWNGPIINAGNEMKIVTNVIKQSVLQTNQSGSNYWGASTFGPGAEVYITIPTLWGNDNSDMYLWMHGGNEGIASVSGYFLYIFQVAGAFTWQLYRKDSGTDTQLGANIGTQTVSSGDSIGLQCSPSGVFQAWYKASGGSWATTGGTRSDTTYTSGHIGVSKGFMDTTSTMDDFGGGNVTATIVDSDDCELSIVVFS